MLLRMMTPAALFVLLSLLGQICDCYGANVARSGKVTQSSVFEDAAPERAIDGNCASLWEKKSCTHTILEESPWWRLDLLNAYKIKTVVITNRRDCCHERLNGAEIRIGNSLSSNGNANPRCAVITAVAAGLPQVFDCNGMEGRYVNIVIPGRKKYLTLCEVEVHGELSGFPILRNGRVTQSSQSGDAVPERAFDGNRASDWIERSCAHTNLEQNPWWRLDLLDTYNISTVTITNRRDCCHERLNGAEIRIGNSLNDNGNANPRCAVITAIPAGSSQTFVCNGMEGRYVNIVIPGRQESLTLCEVEVNVPPSGTPVALGGRVSQSSQFGDAVAERAFDGNHASHWDNGSCSHTNLEINPWWRLDLQNKFRISSVTITNRRDCCHERLNGAEIRVGNSLSSNGNANPRCASITAMAPGSSQTFECNGMQGRYVNIVIPGRNEYLTLCEVEVFGYLMN
ncbi:uncharacterized protein LOC114448631 isoform X2 [Parambassis ranga]|nr:uncharacterized protein LOC114448631 isoform X2 [Parambassis ranga]